MIESASSPGSRVRRPSQRATSRTIGLLVTSAVRPHLSLASYNRSASSRLTEYKAGLDGWAFFEPLGPIVVCEGSSFPEADFRAAVSRTDGRPVFEYLSYPPREDTPRGKGRAELELIAKAIADSEALAGVDMFLKATGRYVTRNGKALVDAIVAQPQLPDVQVNLHNRFSYADSRVFLFSREFFYSRLYPRRDEISDADGTWLEHVLASATLAHAAGGGHWDLLPLPLWIRGVAGTTGQTFGASRGQYMRARTAHWIKRRALGARIAAH